MTCLGDVVAALVDGELDHAARERAQRHLAHCADCRAAVDADRRQKARLAALRAEPVPSAELTARLLALRPPAGPALHPPVVGPRPLSRRPAGRLPARSAWSTSPRTGPAAGRPAARPGRLRRSAATATGLVVLGLSAALVLGGAPPTAPSTPVDPGSDVFVVDFVSTTSDVRVVRGSVGGGR